MDAYASVLRHAPAPAGTAAPAIPMTKPETRKQSVAIKVPFHDLDPVGIVWHGNYSKYFEIARCALLETFDYNYDRMAESGYAWPIIDLHLRYVKVARFGEVLNVEARL